MSGSKSIPYEDRRLMCLSFLLFLPVLLDFIKVRQGGESSLYTYIVYVVSLIAILVGLRRDVTVKSVGLLFLFYFIFGFSYVMFPETQEYYATDGFLILCVYFLPIVFFVIRKIDLWDKFFLIMAWFGLLAVLMGLYIVFFSGVDNYSADERYFTYMEFSYGVLPFVCSLYKQARESMPWTFFPFFILGFIEMFAFGSRATVLFVLLFVFFSELLYRSRNIKGILTLLLIIGMVALNFENIVSWLAGISGIGDSYVLRHIIVGELFQHDTREVIYSNCQNRISSMGFDICGFFGDRMYCGSIYPHNIIYEIMMQWGWLLGSVILLYILYLIIKSFLNDHHRIVLVFLVCCLLGRFFVSGTYVVEGRFWVFYGCLLALTSSKKTINKYAI